MRVTFILVCCLVFYASASTYSQNTRFTLNYQNATILELIQDIESQSKFIFLYQISDLNLNKKVSADFKNATIEEILDFALKGEGLTYEVFEKQILISKEERGVDPGVESTQQPQKKVLSGTVKDTKGLPLPGVSILVKGTTIGIITDNEGNFRLSVPVDAKTLVFSFVGMKLQEFPVSGKTALSVVMEEEAVGLDDVVVVAYGTQKKVSITGAVSSILTKNVKQSPSANFVGAIAGRLPGLITVQNSGQPGAEGFNIYLRGVSTTNGQNPLILIDGVPRDNITTIDPNEVASISILKDASSTAVFGVRGANGVILITTKRGTMNESPQLNVTAEFGLQDFTRDFDFVDSWDYAIMKNQALANDGLLPLFSQESIEKYKNGIDRFMYPNTNWFNVIFRKNTPLTRYNMNVSGGTNRVKYFMNAAYTHQGGMFNTEPKTKLGYDPQYKMDRYNFRTNLDININSWIKSTVNLAGYIEKVNEAGSNTATTALQRGDPGSIVEGVYSLIPTMPGPVTIDGYGVPADEVIGSTLNNAIPYGFLNRTGFVNIDRSYLNASVVLEFDLNTITKGLTSKAMVSFDSRSTGTTAVTKNFTQYNYVLSQKQDPVTAEMKDQLTFVPVSLPQFYPLNMVKSTAFAYAINLQWAINYNQTFKNKHQVTGMVLAQRDNNEAASGSSDLLLPYNMLGVSGRATYGYDNRYLVEFNAGYNGSEQFQREQRFGFFPAASVGWVVSNEKFMKAQKVVTNLKLRASYGKVGNDKLGSDRFLYLDNISAVSGGYSASLGLGKYISRDLVGNQMLTWETAYKQNYGFAFTLLSNLNFTGDLFFEDRKDILITRGTVPAIQGLPLDVVPKANMGEVSNKGFELELVYKKIVNKDFSLIVSGNYNFNKNSVKNMDEPAYDSSYAYKYRKTGYSISQNWGYLIDWESKGKGYFTSLEEITNSGLTYSGIKPRPGDFVYKDLNGDKIIDVKDQSPIRYGFVPRITYGANLSFTYKGFDFTALIQGVAQTSQYYSGYGMMETLREGNFYDIHRNAWTKERYEAGEKITYPALSSRQGSSATQNDFYIMDRSYIRLKNAEIGYTLPQHLSKRLGTKKMRVYVNGQNVFVWDKLRTKNFDPEQNAANSVPIMRVFNLGANIVF